MKSESYFLSLGYILPVRPWLKFTLVGVTILGGLHGIVISLQALFTSSSLGFGELVLFGSFLIAYIYATWAGVMFWRQPKQTRLLMIALAMQIPRISIPGLVYKFTVGFYIAVALVAQHLGDKYSAGANWNFSLGSSCELRLFQNAPIEVGINIAPLAGLLLLRRAVSTKSMSPKDLEEANRVD